MYIIVICIHVTMVFYNIYHFIVFKGNIYRWQITLKIELPWDYITHDNFMNTTLVILGQSLFAHSGVEHILCCVLALFFPVLCTLCCQFL
jgi:hypothetical protein